MSRLTEVFRRSFHEALPQLRLSPIAQIVVLALSGASANSVHAQHWLETTAPITNWVALTCSADGSKLVALAVGFDANPGPMFSSSDGGLTWHQTSAPITNWMSIACSADGEKIVATADAYPGGASFWTSTNAGATWIATNYPAGVASIASSSDGATLVTVIENSLGISADGGSTWTTNDLPGLTSYLGASVVSSADGTRLAALRIDPASTVFWLFGSTNSGATWTESFGPDPSSNWGSLACSANGALLVAAIPIFGVFISSDWGQSWQQPNSNQGIAVASSADGAKLVMTDGASIYRSTDSGNTWNKTDAPTASWRWLASSADGNKLFAAAERAGGIYFWQAAAGSITQLNVTQTQAGVLLWWDAPSTAILQQNGDLATGNWMPVMLTPTLTNGRYELLVPATNTSSLFRLKGS